MLLWKGSGTRDYTRFLFSKIQFYRFNVDIINTGYPKLDVITVISKYLHRKNIIKKYVYNDFAGGV